MTMCIACDRCRKSKSKCVPAVKDKRCKACVAADAGARTCHRKVVAKSDELDDDIECASSGMAVHIARAFGPVTLRRSYLPEGTAQRIHQGP